MGKRASLFVIAVAAVCATAPLASCLDATELVVQLSTDVDCNTVQKTHVLVRVGSPSNIDTNPPTQFESDVCPVNDATVSSSANDLGSIVVLPSSGFDSAVAISVALSNKDTVLTSACFPESSSSPSCIYAHRQISFLPHARVTLPILLSSLCAGVSCKSPLTCNPENGKCEDGTVDVRDCGSSCSTGDDGGGVADAVIDVPITIDSPVFDSPVFDSPVFDSPVTDAPNDVVTTCGSGKIPCNNVCVDPLTDKNNCGACNVDCSQGTCSNALCTIDSTATGSCLGISNGDVYVATSAGVYVYPSNGGSGSLYANVADKTPAMASMPGHLGWFVGNVQQPYVWDLGSKKAFNESTTTSTSLMAVNAGAYAWYDQKAGQIMYQSTSQVSPTAYQPVFSTTSPVPVAMSASLVYASLNLTGQLLYTSGSAYQYVANVPSPGAIIVDDPTKSTPTVFDVEKGSTVIQRDYQLANPKTFASTSAQITSIVWDGSTILANMTTQIAIVQNGSFVKIAAATPAPKCIAVDSNAVYWLDATAGLYKHAK